MLKKISILIGIIIFITINLASQSRGVRVRIKHLNPNNPVGKQYLVLIGINKYQHWNALRGPVKDAKEIGDILNKHYYIDKTLELYDEKASKGGIIKLFKHLQKELKRDDSLLIFYAGHGHLDRASNTGYWIPIDGGNDEDIMDKWIPNSLIRGLIGKIRSKHILLISDSCFSGDILNPNRAKLPKISNNYFKQAYMRRSRQVLTSGASETVPDTSVFARQLKLALRENKRLYIDPLILYNEIRLGMSGTLPLFGNLIGTNHQKGASFLLFRKDVSKVNSEPEFTYKANIPSGSEEFDFSNLEKEAQKTLKIKEREKKAWSSWQKKFSDTVKTLKKYDDNNNISSLTKQRAWEKILSNYNQNNPYSGEDEKLRGLAKKRIEFWKSKKNILTNYSTDKKDLNSINNEKKTMKLLSKKNKGGIRLRSIGKNLSNNQAQLMIKKNGFRENAWNKNGSFTNDYLSKKISGDQVIIDKATDLMWHQSGSSKRMTPHEAWKWIRNLNKMGYASYRDWRLPTLEEGASLLESIRSSHGLYIDSRFNKKQWVILTCDLDGVNYSWYIWFKPGHVNSNNVFTKYYIRPVRSMNKSVKKYMLIN